MTNTRFNLLTGPLATAMDVVGTIMPPMLALAASFQLTHHMTILGVSSIVTLATFIVCRLMINYKMRGLCKEQNTLIQAYRDHMEAKP